MIFAWSHHVYGRGGWGSVGDGHPCILLDSNFSIFKSLMRHLTYETTSQFVLTYTQWPSFLTKLFELHMFSIIKKCKHIFQCTKRKSILLVRITTFPSSCMTREMERGCVHTMYSFPWNHRWNTAARGHHSWFWPKTTTSMKSMEPLFAAGGSHDCLWPKVTRSSNS